MATFGPDDVKVFSEAPSLFVYEHAGNGDSIVESQAIVLLKGEHGLLLLLPAGAIPEEELVQGVLVPVPDLLGPSRVIEVGAVRLVGSEVVPVADMVLTALLVDFSTAVLAKLYAVNQAEDPELHALHFPMGKRARPRGFPQGDRQRKRRHDKCGTKQAQSYPPQPHNRTWVPRGSWAKARVNQPCEQGLLSPSTRHATLGGSDLHH